MTKTAKDTLYMNAAVTKLAIANRAAVEQYLQQRTNEGLGSSSLYNYALALKKLDAHLEGRSFATASEDDLRGFLATLAGGHATRSQTAILVRAFLKWLYHVKELPDHLDRATYVRPPPFEEHGRVLREDEFQALLEATTGLDGPRYRTVRPERYQALLWTLWDTGFRASELLSLRVGSIEWDDHAGARLRLPPQARTEFKLKTGPRTVYVVECVGALRVWLALHPAGMDPAAPLFPNAYDHTGQKPLSYTALSSQLRRLGDNAGLNDNADKKAISAHDFRHTRATRAARANWAESKMRKYFGWRPTSKMPAIYTHMAHADLREQVRRDAGVDQNGYRLALEAGDDVAALQELLRRFLRGDTMNNSIGSTMNLKHS